MNKPLTLLLTSICVVVPACGGEDPSTSSLAVEVTSTTTTIAPQVSSQMDLEKALPEGIDLPAGWSIWGGVESGLSRASETGGYCNGPSQIQRAVNSQAIGYAAISLQNGERPTAFFSLGVYAFPDASAAERFVRMSSEAAATCTSFETTALETEVDGFLEGNEDTEWRIFMSLGTGSGYATDADLSGLITESSKYTATIDNFGYSFEELTFIQYDVYGTVVTVTSVSQRSAFAGYSDSGSGPEEVVLSARDLQLLDQIKKRVISSLSSKSF